MKYLLLLVFLTGCSTMSDYTRGCYDTMDKLFESSRYNSSEYREQTDEGNRRLEDAKVQLCQELNNKNNKRERPQKEYGKPY